MVQSLAADTCPAPPRSPQYAIVGKLSGKALAQTAGQVSGAIPAPSPPRGPTFRSEAAKMVAQEAAAGRDATAAFGR